MASNCNKEGLEGGGGGSMVAIQPTSSGVSVNIKQFMVVCPMIIANQSKAGNLLTPLYLLLLKTRLPMLFWADRDVRLIFVNVNCATMEC